MEGRREEKKEGVSALGNERVAISALSCKDNCDMDRDRLKGYIRHLYIRRTRTYLKILSNQSS